MKDSLLTLVIISLMMNCTTMKIPEYTVKEQDLKQSKQLMLVTAEDWKSDKGELRMYEWVPGKWRQYGQAIPVRLGRNGMVWGNGIVGYEKVAEMKTEGDGKTPAGIYPLEFVYGYAEPFETEFIKLPYMMCNEVLKCVDDVHSKYYNKIVSEDIIDDKDWESAEDMKRDDHLYKWGIVMDFNYNNPQPGEGSCIFVHLWRTPDTPTEGCTAMSEENMLKVLEWLDPKYKPLIAQFPAEVYSIIRESLSFPLIQR